MKAFSAQAAAVGVAIPDSAGVESVEAQVKETTWQ